MPGREPSALPAVLSKTPSKPQQNARFNKQVALLHHVHSIRQFYGLSSAQRRRRRVSVFATNSMDVMAPPPPPALVQAQAQAAAAASKAQQQNTTSGLSRTSSMSSGSVGTPNSAAAATTMGLSPQASMNLTASASRATSATPGAATAPATAAQAAQLTTPSAYSRREAAKHFAITGPPAIAGPDVVDMVGTLRIEAPTARVVAAAHDISILLAEYYELQRAYRTPDLH